MVLAICGIWFPFVSFWNDVVEWSWQYVEFGFLFLDFGTRGCGNDKGVLGTHFKVPSGALQYQAAWLGFFSQSAVGQPPCLPAKGAENFPQHGIFLRETRQISVRGGMRETQSGVF